MPVRIKPIHDLKPCVLDMASIKGICKLVDENFNAALYSAEDGMWEVYDETSTKFLTLIGASDSASGMPMHETLDSFIIRANNQIRVRGIKEKTVKTNREIEILFDKNEATVKFSGPYNMESWFEHFVTDLKKYLQPPTFQQRINFESVSRNRALPYPKFPYLRIPRSSIGAEILGMTIEFSKAPYSTIILYKKSPNALIENIKAGLITNFLWVPIVFGVGILFSVLAYWILSKYNLNIYEWITPPAIPTITPTP